MIMKRVMKFLLSGAIVLGAQLSEAQTADDERMSRDIAVAENALSTLIKQEFSKRSFFPVEVNGSYRSGYGVTFMVPTDMLIPTVWGAGRTDMMILDGRPGVYSYSYSTAPEPQEYLEEEMAVQEKELAEKKRELSKIDKNRTAIGKKSAEMDQARAEIELRDTRERQKIERPQGVRAPRVAKVSLDTDSLQKASSEKIILAAKNFIADYGDMISLLKPEEKIVITNKTQNSHWFHRVNEQRSLISVEATKGDLIQFRQGKITRDQMLAKIQVTNTESTGKVEQDLELLVSMFGRLYRNDLSRTFFVESEPYYERLNDFGAIVYMQVYSSNQMEEDKWLMPTLGLKNITGAERDKKVKELYPMFENDLKENMLDYGRTVKSLKDGERLVFNVILTKCKTCGIPSDIEVSVPNSVLKDYSAGKIDKNAALNKITVKKGAGQ
jgi:hypothetical protein